MKLGTFHLHSVPPWSDALQVQREHWEQILAAEAAGLDEVWLAEHNGRAYGMIGSTVVLAAAIAAATKRIRIGTAVTRLPLHNATHLAEDLAFVDILSEGRLDWGVGKGYDLLEFGTYGVDYDRREELWEENFSAVLQMWTTGRTEFRGEHFNANDGALLPLPLQRPTPPIYVMVSGSESSVAWAAQRGLPMALGSGLDTEEVRDRMGLYGETAANAGLPEDLIRRNLSNTWQLRQCHVATTTEQAVKEFEKGVVWYFSELGNRAMFGFSKSERPYSYFVEHSAFIVGSEEKVTNELGEYAIRTGVNNVICFVNLGGQPHEQVLDAVRRLGERVLPQIRSIHAPSISHAPDPSPTGAAAGNAD